MSAINIGPAHIWALAKTRRITDHRPTLPWGASSQSPKSVVCTTAMSGERPSPESQEGARPEDIFIEFAVREHVALRIER